MLSTLLRRLGYATALFGKWHLGHQPTFNPLRRGFDEYFGIPYPNDCSNKFHPIVRTFPPLPLMEGEKVVAEEPDQALFTGQFTKRAVDFIGKNKDRPFFLYLAHVMPHVPIHPFGEVSRQESPAASTATWSRSWTGRWARFWLPSKSTAWMTTPW